MLAQTTTGVLDTYESDRRSACPEYCADFAAFIGLRLPPLSVLHRSARLMRLLSSAYPIENFLIAIKTDCLSAASRFGRSMFFEQCIGAVPAGGEMFGFFKKNDDLVVLNQKLGRLLNVYAKADMDDQRRSESRVRLAMPCLIFLYKEAAAPQSYASGITADVSLHGMGVYTYDNLEEGEYILVFGPKDLRIHVAASCKRFVRSDLNCNSVAFSFIRVMSGKEIQPINSAIETLEAARSAASTPA